MNPHVAEEMNAQVSEEIPVSEEAPEAEEISGDHDDQEKHPADQRKGPDEFFSVSGIFPYIDPVIDDGCKGSDERAESRRVRTVYESGEVFGEGIKYDRCGYVRYDLAQCDD